MLKSTEKMLSEIAICDPEGFTAIVETAKKSFKRLINHGPTELVLFLLSYSLTFFLNKYILKS